VTVDILDGGTTTVADKQQQEQGEDMPLLEQVADSVPKAQQREQGKGMALPEQVADSVPEAQYSRLLNASSAAPPREPYFPV
jgi:hypothetical protein